MKAASYDFDECPSYLQALNNLKESLRLEQVPDAVQMVKVADATDAQTKRFLGSPTIRIDGVDVKDRLPRHAATPGVVASMLTVITPSGGRR